MNPRVLIIIAIIVLMGYGIYLMLTPPKPQVVVVKPSQNQTTAAPQPLTQPSVDCVENVYVKIWGTEVCGGIVYSMEFRNDVYVLYIENVSVRGKFVIRDSGCTIIPQFNGWIKLMCKSYILITQ